MNLNVRLSTLRRTPVILNIALVVVLGLSVGTSLRDWYYDTSLPLWWLVFWSGTWAIMGALITPIVYSNKERHPRMGAWMGAIGGALGGLLLLVLTGILLHLLTPLGLLDSGTRLSMGVVLLESTVGGIMLLALVWLGGSRRDTGAGEARIRLKWFAIVALIAALALTFAAEVGSALFDLEHDMTLAGTTDAIRLNQDCGCEGEGSVLLDLLAVTLVIALAWFVVPERDRVEYESLSSKQVARLNHRALLVLSFALGLVVVAILSYNVYEYHYGMSISKAWTAAKAVVDSDGVLLINALVGVSVLLFIVELRWDALRVTLTVGVALILGYLVTAAFHLDTPNLLDEGDFRVAVISENEPITDINYGGEISETFVAPEENALPEVVHGFAGTAGDVVSILAFPDDDESTLDLQVALLDRDGTIVAESRSATSEQLEAYRDLKSERDAVIENLALPADGVYTVRLQAQQPDTGLEDEFTLTLESDAEPPFDLVYGDQTGDTFNKEGAAEPLKEASYRFAGREGDVVTVLSAQKNSKVDLQVALLDENGNTLAESKNATGDQIATISFVKSKRDAVIDGFTLPTSGFYTIYTKPQKINAFREIRAATSQAYKAFLVGPLSRLNRWGIFWIRDAFTLILLGLAIVLVFRAQQFSLGAEGQLYFGALVSGVIAIYFSDAPRAFIVPLALISAATVGFLWGLLPGALKAYLGANELVSTLMLNTIATRFYEMVLTEQLVPPNAGQTVSERIPKAGLLPTVVDIRGEPVSSIVYIVIAMVIVTWLIIRRTPIGYEIRMIGANIKFADYGGVNTKRTIMLSMALSGAVAGLAGAHLVMGSVHRQLALGISVGLAFEGIVVALLARNNPLVVPFTGLLYQYLRAGARVMESDTEVSFEVVRVIQAVIILLITAEALVALFQRRRRARRRGTIELDMDAGQDGIAAASGPTEEASHAQ